MRSLFGVLIQSVLRSFHIRAQRPTLFSSCVGFQLQEAALYRHKQSNILKPLKGFSCYFVYFAMLGIENGASCSYVSGLLLRYSLGPLRFLKTKTVMNLFFFFCTKLHPLMGHSYQLPDIVTQMGSLFSVCKSEQSLIEERNHERV